MDSVQELSIEKIRHYFLIMAWLLLCASGMTQYMFEEGSGPNLGILSIVFLMLSIDYTKLDYSKVLIFILLFAGLFVKRWIGLASGFLILYQLCEDNISIKKLSVTFLTVIIIGLIIQYYRIQTGQAQELSEISFKTGWVAHDFGFGNPNNFGAFIIWIISTLYLTMKDNNLKLFIIIGLVMNAWGYYYCSSRTQFYAGLVLVFVAILYKTNLIKTWCQNLIGFLPTFFTILDIILAYNAGNYYNLDTFASGRLNIMEYIMNQFTFLDWIIGAPLEEGIAFDNSYLFFIQQGGIVLSLFFCISFFLSVTKYFDRLVAYLPFILAALIGSNGETMINGGTGFSILLWVFAFYWWFPTKLE